MARSSDFCYRARKLGWRHIVAGDVFVRHLEGQSFGERKSRLVLQMMDVFIRLHPEIQTNDAEFRRRDPIRPLREALDLARLKLLLAGATALPCIIRNGAEEVRARGSVLVVDVRAGEGQIVVPGIENSGEPADPRASRRHRRIQRHAGDAWHQEPNLRRWCHD